MASKIPVRFVPLPRPASLPLMHSRFRAKWTDTFGLLQHELGHLDARDVIIEAGYGSNQIRNDGWPMASSKPNHPAVRISFNSHGRSLAFPCYRYADAWDNVRAIALSLEALRAVDRYGVTREAEQYKGWAQLEAPKPAAMEQQQALAFMVEQAQRYYGSIVRWETPDEVRDLYRMLAKRLHPDVRGGDRTEWNKLEAAYAALKGTGA